MSGENNQEKSDYSSNQFELHLTVGEGGESVVDQLNAETGLSKTRLKHILKSGAVWLSRGKNTRRIRRATLIPESGDILHLYYDRDVFEAAPSPATLIADEGDFSVWRKPPGTLSQGSKWGDNCTIQRWAEQHLQPQRPAFVVHRLDRAASGLILIAHKKSVAADLAQLFQKRSVGKDYEVFVHGEFPLYRQTFDAPMDGKPAKSSARRKLYDRDLDCSLLEVTIESGRKHQIRRHLADAGFPVVGDRLYGRETDTADLQLVSTRLSFEYPPEEARSYELPDKFRLHPVSGRTTTDLSE